MYINHSTHYINAYTNSQNMTPYFSIYLEILLYIFDKKSFYILGSTKIRSIKLIMLETLILILISQKYLAKINSQNNNSKVIKLKILENNL